MPTRPSTARTSVSTGPHAGRGAKHYHLIAELEDAKQLLETIQSKQENKRPGFGGGDAGGELGNNNGDSGGLAVGAGGGGGSKRKVGSSELTGNSSSSLEPSSEEPATSSSGSSGEQQESLVNAAIIQAVQLQMLRQWPQKKMSLRVRQLVHSQLRGRAQLRAKNVELDHATQRLNDKESTTKNKTAGMAPDLSVLPPRKKSSMSSVGKRIEPQSPFSSRQTGASPLIRFRRMTSGL